MNDRSSGEPPMWAWVEISPGVSTASPASTTSTSAPVGVVCRGPTETMRSPSTITAPSRSRRWPRPSNAMTWRAWMAKRRGMAGPPSGERSYRGSPRLDRPRPAWSHPGTMRIPELPFKRKQWEPLAFASPSMVLIAFVIVFPLAYSFYLSFQNFDLSVGPEYEFVGVKNYTEAILRDERFMGSIWNTAVIIAPSLLLELLLGLGIALLLSRVLRGRPIITALLVIPSMVSPVMAAMAWRMMYGVKYGAINNLGRQLGILDVYFDWFSSPLVSIIAVVLVEVWHNTPFMMLVLLAGLQSIPTELYEAARADGASAWQRFWSITLPLLKFTMAVGVMIRLIDLTKLFGLIFVLTYGGPGGSTETVAFTTYLMGFKDFRMSYAAALSYVIVGGVLVLTLVFMWIQRARETRVAA